MLRYLHERIAALSANMPKLDIEFEITGLKLKIKGESDDVSGKVANLQNQVQNLMGSIASLTQGAAATNGTLPAAPAAAPKQIEAEVLGATTTRQRRSSPLKGKPATPKAEAVDFKHDAEKYGFPKQTWSTAQKAMWTIYMLGDLGETKEFSAGAIAASFNMHFKSFGAIRPQNVLRDLGNEKGKSGAVNSDATQDPMKWYLLEAGKTIAAGLVAETKGTPSA